MSTYRERREARAERLEGWAAGRDAKAEAAFTRAHDMASVIPFGQPILTDHYSAGRDRRYRDRIGRTMDASIEHAEKARSMASRAATIKDQLAGSIYSDDPDAIEALRARIAGLEAERDRIKAYNATCRKGAPDQSLLTDAERRDLATVLRYAPHQSKGGAFPGYKLSNLNGNLNRNRKRLAELEEASR